MATTPVTGYCTFHTTRESEVPQPTVRVHFWERRLSGSARRTQVAADAWHPAIRLPSRMLLCIEPRPSLRSEDPVGITLAGPTGSLFLRGGENGCREGGAPAEPRIA